MIRVVTYQMPLWRNWQTRNVQVVVWVSKYRFDSCQRHSGPLGQNAAVKIVEKQIVVLCFRLRIDGNYNF